ncbi:hypothetical protein JTE90_025516, partial [Oedothorax gibbosus]
IQRQIGQTFVPQSFAAPVPTPLQKIRQTTDHMHGLGLVRGAVPIGMGLLRWIRDALDTMDGKGTSLFGRWRVVTVNYRFGGARVPRFWDARRGCWNSGAE